MSDPLNPPDVLSKLLPADGAIPNNESCPLLAYRDAVRLPDADPASLFETLFERNGWTGSWRNGVFPFHHFHSTAHEVLGVYAGEATILLGGPGGVTVAVSAGDVVIIPAGVGHKRLDQSGGFAVVGAYPTGQSPDLCRGERAGGSALAEAVRRVPLPGSDPVYGATGPLLERWSARAA